MVDTSKNVFGVVYSEFGELGPRPETWIPESLEYDAVLEILMRSTCFISIELIHMKDRLAVFPFPEYNLVGISYYFIAPKSSAQNHIASITILLNEQSQEFANCNSTNIKAHLRSLADQLNHLEKPRILILNDYLFELEELISGYKSLETLKAQTDYESETNKKSVLLSYFHAKIGPMPFYMYPEIPFDEQNKLLISKELEFGVSHGFFTRTYPNFVTLHHYFELPSKLARGKTEMCLLTFIFDKLPTQETITHISFNLQKLIALLKEQPEVTYGFYEEGYDFRENWDTIHAMYLVIKQWVKTVYEVCIENRDFDKLKQFF
ncbi:MAG: hypothetical protein ACTSRC_14595 [Candidatus Helarchaeota archaeon]